MNGLIPGALAAWVLVLVANLLLAQGFDPGLVVRAELGLALASAGVFVWALAWRHYSAAALTGVVAAALLSSASYAATVTAAPLQAVGARVTMEATVIGDMRMRESFGEPSLDVRAHAESVSTAAGTWELGAPVMIRIPPEEAPPIGARVTVTGSLREGDPLRGLAALIDAERATVIEPPGVLGGLANSVRGALRTSL